MKKVAVMKNDDERFNVHHVKVLAAAHSAVLHILCQA
jgi:hypothetical protein